MNVLPEYKRNFYYALGILIAYCIFRLFIYLELPAHDYDSWVIRDTVMNVPRLICFGLLIFIVYRKYKIQDVTSPIGSEKIKILWVSAFLMLMIALRMPFFELYSHPWKSLVILTISSLIVGFFEEILFRGAIFDSLKKWRGTGFAILCSSALFLLFHIQAQKIETFPLIFLLGILFSLLRLHGATLLQLSILHAIYDVLVLLWIPTAELNTVWVAFEFLYVLILIFFTYFLFSKAKEKLSY